MKNRIYLKPLTVAYLEEYLTYVNDPELHKTTEPYKAFRTYSEDETRAWLTKIPTLSNRADFAIHLVDGDHFIGEVVLNEVKDQSANIRIGIKTAYQNKGYGSEAMQLAIQYGFTKMDLEQITLSVFILNPRGVHVYEKLGFVETGRGVYEGYDEIYMSLKKT